MRAESRSFFRKLALALLPWLLLTLGLVVHREKQIASMPAPFSSAPHRIDESARVFIGGDSRAKRQLIPQVLFEETGARTLNLAWNAADLLTFYHYAKAHSLLGRGKIFVLSASIFQVNDGAIDEGYLSFTQFWAMTPLERLMLFKAEYFNKTKNILAAGATLPPLDVDAFLVERGDVSCQRVTGNPADMKHPWYKRIDLKHARWRLTQEAIQRFSEEGANDAIVIYNAPLSPAFKNCIRGSYVEEAERQFAAQMRTFINEKAKNTLFVDFSYDQQPMWGNELFYDIQHLNKQGARLFSKHLARMLREDPLTAPLLARPQMNFNK